MRSIARARLSSPARSRGGDFKSERSDKWRPELARARPALVDDGRGAMATPTRAPTPTNATRAMIRRASRPRRACPSRATTTTRARSLADDARAQGAALDGVDGAWISGMVTFWLDEEWERGAVINRAIGDAVASSYASRVEAMDVDESEPMQKLVFGMAEDLLTFDFSDSFVSAFEVSNKVIEMLMLRAGVDVCCVSEEDLTRAERYEESLRAGSTD